MTTYSSPKSQFCPKWEESVNVDLGEGWVVIYNLNWSPFTAYSGQTKKS